jgi:hypothetical protein
MPIKVPKQLHLELKRDIPVSKPMLLLLDAKQDTMFKMFLLLLSENIQTEIPIDYTQIKGDGPYTYI